MKSEVIILRTKDKEIEKRLDELETALSGGEL